MLSYSKHNTQSECVWHWLGLALCTYSPNLKLDIIHSFIVVPFTVKSWDLLWQGIKYAQSNLMLDWSLFLTLVYMKESELGFKLGLIFHIHPQFKFMLASKQSENVYSPRWLSLGSSSQCTQSSWTLVGVCLYWLYYCKFENINEAMRVYFNHWKLAQWT